MTLDFPCASIQSTELAVLPCLGKGKLGSTRALLATNRDNRWFFLFGFEKNERDNITESELDTLKKLAKDLLGLTAGQIAAAVKEGSLVEVEHEA
ncbi:MAG TPA: type II toxin-antitoxin system RelE/ParE family toxin [Smithellaceae bacterium]|nr:type II toxin-antitoxin system RelE/ParE family toxin [Smithellaceae bacterium]